MTNRDILDELRVRGELAERLKRMAPRYREIITLRYGLSFETGLIVRGEMTLEQVAKLYSITNERLRQIEKKVFKELSEGLTVSPWHTGTPTEEGWYVIAYKPIEQDSPLVYYTLHQWRDAEGYWQSDGIRPNDFWKPIAWQKIDSCKED